MRFTDIYKQQFQEEGNKMLQRNDSPEELIHVLRDLFKDKLELELELANPSSPSKHRHHQHDADETTRTEATASFNSSLSSLDVTLTPLQDHGHGHDSDHDHGMLPLHWACRRGQVNLLRDLIRHEAAVGNAKVFVNTADAAGRTPLMYACRNVHTKVVQLLLKYGADVHVNSDRGQTALEIACRHNNFYTAQLLCETTSVDVEGLSTRLSNDDRTILHKVCQQHTGNNLSMVKLLLHNGANPNAQSATDGTTPLHAAVACNNAAVVTCLLERGACPNTIRNHDGHAPLHLAYRLGHYDLAETMLRRILEQQQQQQQRQQSS